MEVDELHKVLIDCLKNKNSILIEWKHGLEINGIMITAFETDNGLEMDESGYHEYYACAVEIQMIINNNTQNNDENVKEGNLIEVSIMNQPSQIYLEDGTSIWSAKNC